MKIALTGATGFIGRHVLAELANRSHDVVAVSRRASAQPPIRNGRWVQMDLNSPPSDCSKALGRPDVLIHLAWDGLPNYRSEHHVEVELPLQKNFLHAMIAAGLPALLVTGTCLEYGQQTGRLDEGMACLPDTNYAIAKRDLLDNLLALKKRKPFVFTWARLFYLFGEGQSEKSLWSQFDDACGRGETTFNMSGGEQIRDFLPVKKAARYLVDLALDAQGAGVVNVCSGMPVTVRKLVESWIRDRNWRVELKLGVYPYPDYEPMAFWGDATKLERTLGRI